MRTGATDVFALDEAAAVDGASRRPTLFARNLDYGRAGEDLVRPFRA